MTSCNHAANRGRHHSWSGSRCSENTEVLFVSRCHAGRACARIARADRIARARRPARPSAGDDADLVVLDEDRHTSYEFFQARQAATGWRASGGVTFDTGGDGINHAGSGVRASSISLLLGLLTHEEVRGGGPIEHALA